MDEFNREDLIRNEDPGTEEVLPEGTALPPEGGDAEEPKVFGSAPSDASADPEGSREAASFTYGSGSFQSRSSYSAGYTGETRNPGWDASGYERPSRGEDSYRNGRRSYSDQSAYTGSHYANDGYGNGRTGYSSNYDAYRFS